MHDFINENKLNENNLQAPFQYKVSEDNFVLENIHIELELNTENRQVKVFENEKLFCIDLGYSIDGDVYEMNFYMQGVKIYPVVVKTLKELKTVEISIDKFYLVDDSNFKSIIFFAAKNINKTLVADFTTYNTVLSSWMYDDIAKKLNTLDINYPIKNFYQKYSYKAGDIIKKDGYLYKVVKDFRSSKNITNSILITPFKRLEDSELLMYSLVQNQNNFFIVSDTEESLKPLLEIISWNDNIPYIYKNQLLIKDNRRYLVVNDVFNPNFDEILRREQIIELYNANNVYIDNGNSVASEIIRLDTKIDNETTERIKADDNLKQEIDINRDNINNLEDYVNTIKTGKQDSFNAGYDLQLKVRDYEIIKTPISIDKQSPILFEENENSIIINVSTPIETEIEIDLHSDNLEYTFINNKITINKNLNALDKNYNGILEIKANKKQDDNYIYEENALFIFINQNVFNIDLEIENNELYLNAGEEKIINITSNADLIECEIEKGENITTEVLAAKTKENQYQLKIINRGDNKNIAILNLIATKNESGNILYAPNSKKIFINRSSKEYKPCLTLDCLSAKEAQSESLIKRDTEGQAYGKNITLSDDVLINYKTFIEVINKLNNTNNTINSKLQEVERLNNEQNNRILTLENRCNDLENKYTNLQNQINSIISRLNNAYVNAMPSGSRVPIRW